MSSSCLRRKVVTPVSVSPLIEAGERPDDLGQHAEGDDDPEVGGELTEAADEGLVLEPHGLEHLEAYTLGVGLDLALLQLLPAAGGLVGHRDDGHDVVAALDEQLERGQGEVCRRHIDDT